MMPQATIYSVALAAGVSLATVSRVLNNPEKVKQETIEENKTESTISKIETVENTATIPNEAKKTYLVIEVTGLNMNVAKELKQFLDGKNINYKKEIK